MYKAMKSSYLLAVATAAVLFAAPSFGIEMPKVPSLGGTNSSNPTVSGAAVARDARNALMSFASAQLGLAQAMGGYEGLAAQQQMLAGLKSGDAAAKKEDIETVVNISKSAGDAIGQKVAANAQLTAENRQLALNSTVDYIKGLIASKKLVGSVQDLARNPMSLGGDAGSVLYLGKNLPGIVGGGASTTGTLLKYLSANGVDTSKAAAAAKDLGN